MISYTSLEADPATLPIQGMNTPANAGLNGIADASNASSRCSRIKIHRPTPTATHYVRVDDSFRGFVQHFTCEQAAERWAAKYAMRRMAGVCKTTFDTAAECWKRKEYGRVIDIANACVDLSDRFYVREVTVME